MSAREDAADNAQKTSSLEKRKERRRWGISQIGMLERSNRLLTKLEATFGMRGEKRKGRNSAIIRKMTH